jgi:hypothetical protein
VLAVAGVRDPAALRRVHRRLQARAGLARRVAVAGQGLVLIAAAAAVRGG